MILHPEMSASMPHFTLQLIPTLKMNANIFNTDAPGLTGGYVPMKPS